jgi:replicative DNA helicase
MMTEHSKINNLTITENFDKALYSIEAEQSLLGCLLLNNYLFEHVVEFLHPIHFSHPLHQNLYQLIISLVSQNKIADPITLRPILEKDPLLQEVGGINYLIDLVNSITSTVSMKDYGILIHQMYLRRQLSHIGQEITTNVYNYEPDQTAHQQIEQAERKLYELATNGNFNRSHLNFAQALSQALHSAEAAYKRDGSVVGVTSGFIDLDKYLGGLHPSDLIIVAGRPSMGKTAFGTNIAFNAAIGKSNTNTAVAFFSLEMSAEQLASRILSSESGVSSDRIRRGEISQQEFTKLIEVSRKIEQSNLFIDDTPALSISALRNRARRLKRQYDIGLIVIDYLQLLETDSSKRSSDNRVQEISEISRGLKAIAKELSVPIIALSQLSRAVEQREDKRPQLSDLRESGSIEQDADVVMFVYRAEYYEARKEPPIGDPKHLEWQKRISEAYHKAEIIIAKQRHGPIGTVKMYFDGQLTKFSNLSNHQ